MKDCHWCGKSCPDDEEGSFEIDPENNDVEVGWICDHCVLAFDGKCDCRECKEADERADEACRKYKLAYLPKEKMDWGALIACACFAFPLWLLLILYILSWFYD